VPSQQTKKAVGAGQRRRRFRPLAKPVLLALLDRGNLERQ
jgi:hypothetical protein